MWALWLGVAIAVSRCTVVAIALKIAEENLPQKQQEGLETIIGTTQTLAAGPTTFDVKNDDADSITELEIKRDGHIVGEKENLTPGLSGSFSITLKEGEYEVEYPGGASGTVTVRAAAASATTVTGSGNAAGTTTVNTYKKWVGEQTALLMSETKLFTDAVKGRQCHHINHVGSAVFAVPPGIRPCEYVGETLLG
jgi:iron uptake system EfeUOB component EfeO/EfeM